MKKKVLFVGDAACPSGFARSTHAVCDVLHETYDVTVLGINYRADPHSYPYPIYAAAVGGDELGVGRLIWMMDVIRPDVVILQNDPWNFKHYTKQLKKYKEYANVPIVGYVAVDGLNCRGDMLGDLDLAVFWTKFGEREAKLGGFKGRTAVVPLGVDTKFYTPGDRTEARLRLGIPAELAKSVFMVGAVNRNQPRKRFDLVIRYVAEWVKSCSIDDAYLFMHVAPTGDQGFDVMHLARYYGVLPKLILSEPQVFYGVSEEKMRDTYRAFDVALTTTQGEGFGLTTFEAMACGVPVICPDWSALGELCKDAAWLVPCTSTAVTIGSSVIGGVPDEASTVQALSTMYNDECVRREHADRGLALVSRPEYDWRNVGVGFRDALDSVFMKQEAVA